MHSIRFSRTVILTRHAMVRMAERNITESELLSVIDMGETKYKDETHLWTFKRLPGRIDNLICAVLVLENVVVVKTIMHNFELEA